jgi:hypothetical protein
VGINIDEMSVLDRRRIEAMILTPVFKAFAQELGEDKTREIMGRTIVQIAREQGRTLAKRTGASDLQAFARAKEPYTRGNTMEVEVLAADDRQYSFDVTRCKYAEMYNELGIPELGYILSCGRDYAMSQGFNSHIRLSRSQTIMQGASHCDFRYVSDKDTKNKG